MIGHTTVTNEQVYRTDIWASQIRPTNCHFHARVYLEREITRQGREMMAQC